MKKISAKTTSLNNVWHKLKIREILTPNVPTIYPSGRTLFLRLIRFMLILITLNPTTLDPQIKTNVPFLIREIKRETGTRIRRIANAKRERHRKRNEYSWFRKKKGKERKKKKRFPDERRRDVPRSFSCPRVWAGKRSAWRPVKLTSRLIHLNPPEDRWRDILAYAPSIPRYAG